MAHKRIKGDRRKRLASIGFLLAGVIAISGMFAGGVAKYAHKESNEEKGDSEQFYFTSDYLTEEGTTYTLSADTNDLEIELRNYEDVLRWADSEIAYSYTVTKDGTEVSEGNGTITKRSDAGNKEAITIEKMSAGTYQVEVTATSPYTKTLKGTFTIPEENDEIDYTVSDSDGSPYVLLTISSTTYEGNVTIGWSEGLIPDNTQTEFEKVTTLIENTETYQAGNVNVAVTKNSSYTYRFFKTNTGKIYSKQNITVTKTE